MGICSLLIAAAVHSTMVAAGPAPRVDRYGGYLERTGRNESGYFRVERMDDRYVLVTPDNHPFLSVAVTTALFNDRWGGRCPPLDSYPNPYGNQAKYNADRSAWETALKANLTRWGFNGLGCWCQEGVPELTENVACLFISMHAQRVIQGGLGRHFVDVFDPKFEEVADQRARGLARYAESPFRIGAFPDNEIGWVGPDVWGREGGPSLPDAFIALPAEAYGKRYWAETICRGKHRTIEALNRAYGTDFTDFTGEGNTLVQATKLPNDPAHPAIFEDKCDFVEAIADRYYRVVTAAMRKHAPNQLVFSARWALWTTAYHTQWPEYQAYNDRIWKKTGEYSDIIAINSYMNNADLEAQHGFYSRVFALTGKPFMITEWASFADDTQFERQPGWLRHQRDRGEFYVREFKTLLDFKFPDPKTGELVHPCLGAQWFQYYDEPSLGRTDGEKVNFGLLNVKDEAYLTALDVMRTFNAQIYDYVFEDKPIRLLDAPEPLSPAAPADETPPSPQQSHRPEFAWKEVEGARMYTLLYSPEKCFPEAQTIRRDGLTSTRFRPEESLPAGLWYWCVGAVDEQGLAGRYSIPVAFRIDSQTHPDRIRDYLDMEDLSAWRNVSLEDGGWNGVTWAFLDHDVKASGRSSARVQFTINSLNKQTGELNDSKAPVYWEYAGPPIPIDDARVLQLKVRPHRAVDVKGEMTVASRFLALRIEDAEGQPLLDERIDPDGRLAPLEWHPLSFALQSRSSGEIARLALYADGAIENIPWDQRLIVWIDALEIPSGE